ncbi:polysaccharide deacetylase family protein [Salinimicrobium sediminilitoris]|uniref:polysaccharide deacetylase family protein n=1 Tax=Salinimicrobium sediminilitoris TaxID=2876715 RepID=UPI001E63553B|nr:polysaccharide deacetylase family protein [Salinimicrobium sediminilitoris]MCC8358734.1 polysaccharide deacetylase family protein [Salinimicrobium sediminilitoris]
MNNGHLVISLDMELLWGIFDKVDYRERETYFRNTRRIIPQVLRIFRDYDIHATWAVVGMLFNKNWKEWENNIPERLPKYTEKQLSPYIFANSIIEAPGTEKYVFARDLIHIIQKTPFQEIGTHTYSHFYCLEPGQDVEDFKQDLKKSILLARNMNINLRSLVFPRNQFNEKYLEVCRNLGIESVRSNPEDWYWKNTQTDSLVTKVFRTGDAYFGPRNKSYFYTKEQNNPISQKASRLLRPHSPNKILNTLKIKRIKSEMTYAARNKQIYHLWWHPHNFGNYPAENINDLKIILDHFKLCKMKYNFQSANMNEINTIFKEQKD